MNSTNAFSGSVRSKVARGIFPGFDRSTGWRRALALFGTLAVCVQCSVLTVDGQAPFWQPAYSGGLDSDDEGSAFLPLRPLTLTVLDSEGHPVAGASFSGPYLRSGAGAKSVPV